jgi:hypothetical protein
MVGHDEVEAVFDALEKDPPVVNVNIEFSFHSFVHKNASSDVIDSGSVEPVGSVCDWNSVPSLGVDTNI